MYTASFESDNGKKYLFGTKNGTVFDLDLGDGLSVNIGTSQGFGQRGETVQTQSVSGRTLRISGVVFGNIPERKKALRTAFAPFSRGRLTFQDEYYIRVYVKSAPTFGMRADDGRFSMQLFAPFPFFRKIKAKRVSLGVTTPAFSFPVNYAVEHKFGERSAARYVNVYNDGDVSSPLTADIRVLHETQNIVITNLKTFDRLKINGTFGEGDVIRLHRNEDGIFKAELTSDGVTTDIISRIDEESTLFEVDVGDNLLQVIDDNNGEWLETNITFNTAVATVYET